MYKETLKLKFVSLASLVSLVKGISKNVDCWHCFHSSNFSSHPRERMQYAIHACYALNIAQGAAK